VNKSQIKQKSFRILQGSVLLVFLGRAWQHLFWDAPFRTFFWDEENLKPIIENIFKWDWTAYVTSAQTDQFIQYSVIGFGVLYLICTILTLWWNPKSRFTKIVLVLGGIALLFLAYLNMKENFYRYGQFFEYAIQFSIPFVLVYYHKRWLQRHIELILKLLVAVVFISHGLYAVGYYPIPGHFIGMIITIFGCSQDVAINFLLVAGILDFLVGIAIFIPKLKRYALIYACFWGLMTALARVVSGFYIDFIWQSIHQNLYETLYRLPHGLIPLMLLYMSSEKKKEATTN